MMTDKSILSLYEEGMADLCSGLFSDVMDRMGYQHQVILNMQKNQRTVSFAGRARTILIETGDTRDENIRSGLSFLGSLGKGDVLFVRGSSRFAYFGELMTRLSARQGINGVIIDGLTRDTNYTFRDDVKLPVLAKGYSPVDIKGRGYVKSTDVKTEADGIEIVPGDLVYADSEGVCIIPKKIEQEVVCRVREKIRDEKRIIAFINNGMSIRELLENVTEF